MAAQKKRASKRSNKKMSLKEFRAWLQGVEELQPDDWCPDKEQWKKIRQKIDNIVEEEPQQVVTQAPAPQPQPMQPNGQPGGEMPPMPPPAESAPVAATGPPLPAGSGLEEAAAFAPNKQPGPSMDLPSGPGGGMPGAGAPGTSEQGPRIRTPDIDTSDGSYGSSFE